jgi:hypothetical protein
MLNILGDCRRSDVLEPREREGSIPTGLSRWRDGV